MKKFFKKASYKILPYLIIFAQKILFLTCKKVYELQKYEPSSSPVIWTCWHGQLLMTPYIYMKIKSHKINIMVSEHRHGDMAIVVAKRFDMDFIRGSSRRGAIKVLKSAINAINRGEDIGITPDGPKGPLYSVSDGIIVLSQKCDINIIALGWSVNSYWQLKSWDMTKIPKPFSTITFRASKPFNLKELDKDKAKQKVKDALMACMDENDKALV
ncbi:MAG: lysophospholipid acyltransferase family protein [Campylobacteraceae bacterium]|jgi:lysophospholipid acyltransferase (LPLAT)-like uncharacterized protein|nr:lysophospholipid acyltransferase family protein [Campylobacteraceae bacterium]